LDHVSRDERRRGPAGPARSVAQSKEEILQLIAALAPGASAGPAAPAPAAARLELQRWREAFYRDAVADRLTSLCTLLEERLDALAGEVMAAPLPAEAPRERPAAAAPAAAAPSMEAWSDRPPPPAAPPPADAPPALAAAAPRAVADASLSGRILEGVLSDILQMLSANLRTGRFIITGAEGAAQLWYEDGEITHAVAGDLTGEAAFFAAIANLSGTFAFVDGGAPPPARSINNKTQFLILEGLRKMDEEGQAGEPALSEEHP
jgi:hypothetical protein